MKILPSGSNFDNNHNLVYVDSPVQVGNSRREFEVSDSGEVEPGASFNLFDLLRRYWPLALALVILGAGLGFVSVVLSSPMYKTRLLLEVQSVNDSFLRGAGTPANDESSEVAIQTQINILRSGQFL